MRNSDTGHFTIAERDCGLCLQYMIKGKSASRLNRTMVDSFTEPLETSTERWKIPDEERPGRTATTVDIYGHMAARSWSIPRKMKEPGSSSR